MTSADVIVVQHTNEYRENASRNLGFTYAKEGKSEKMHPPRTN